MNKQRKVVITTTYNEMGIIIDTKAEEVAQPNLQPTCKQLATDTISRQAAIDALNGEVIVTGRANAEAVLGYANLVTDRIKRLPPAQPEIIRCKDCKYYIKSESYCDYLGITISDLDFCSLAERRTDEL